MDIRTGEIRDFKEVEKMVKEKPIESEFWKKVPEYLIPRLKRMNRHQRRKYYTTHKQMFMDVEKK